jgi:hypothetical protein
MPKTRGQIVREVAQEFMKAGKLHAPPDDVSADDDAALWQEVERRLQEQETKGAS